MHFSLVDRVLERGSERIVTLKQVSRAEEYLLDHFATYPVLPGVFMLESMVQAARLLAEGEREATALPMVLCRVRALKYGSFVRPGYTMRVEVDRTARADGELQEFKGIVRLLDPAKPGEAIATACAGRFGLRPARSPTPSVVRPEPAPIG